MNTFSRVISYMFALALLALPVAVWANKQILWDWWQLKGYSPPAAVTELATTDGMTSSARHIFYVNHPQIFSNVSAFRQQCRQNEQTIVLGCYHPPQNGIAIYDVQDPRLNGVEQVTAAHEMLHAAYDRLSAKDKKYVDGLILDYYKNQLHDKRVLNTIEQYKSTEPNDVVNEMHSIFGSEVANLPQPLEDYYKKYFTNRADVTNLAAGYQGEYTSRLNQIQADDQKLEALKNQISSEEKSLNAKLDQINSDRNKLNSLRKSNQISAYNASVTSFNAEVIAYNQGVRKLQADISTYNALVETRNSVAGELRNLDNALDTRLTAQPAQ